MKYSIAMWLATIGVICIGIAARIHYRAAKDALMLAINDGKL